MSFNQNISISFWKDRSLDRKTIQRLPPSALTGRHHTEAHIRTHISEAVICLKSPTRFGAWELKRTKVDFSVSWIQDWSVCEGWRITHLLGGRRETPPSPLFPISAELCHVPQLLLCTIYSWVESKLESVPDSTDLSLLYWKRLSFRESYYILQMQTT